MDDSKAHGAGVPPPSRHLGRHAVDELFADGVDGTCRDRCCAEPPRSNGASTASTTQRPAYQAPQPRR
jgi:hypothetical protein